MWSFLGIYLHRYKCICPFKKYFSFIRRNQQFCSMKTNSKSYDWIGEACDVPLCIHKARVSSIFLSNFIERVFFYIRKERGLEMSV